MDSFLSISFCLLFLVFLSLICFNLFWVRIRSSSSRNKSSVFNGNQCPYPPGPTPLPIIGNLFQLGSHLPHQSLANLANIYGPLMTLKLGSITTVIASSPSMAKQVLQTNDHVFATRHIPDAVRSLNHHEASLVWLPPRQSWRRLRKLSNSQIFTSQRLSLSQAARQQKVKELLAYVHGKSLVGEAVNIGEAAFATMLNCISNTVFSIDLADFQSETVKEFKELMRGVMDEIGRPNIADYFPVLRLFDPLGVRRRTTFYSEKLDETFDELIKQRLHYSGSKLQHSNNASHGDLLDAILEHCQEDGSKLSFRVIKSLLKDIFVAGSDTSSSTLEWAMAELLRNPETMAKAQAEVKEAMKEGNRKVIEESDISRLPYLQAVVKETLRLHPPAPLLLPRKAETDTELCGEFTVPKDALVLVNVWAIGRDPQIWKNPTALDPERFLGSDCTCGFKGRDFELVPFGAGRRICPGLPLADRMVHLMLASLLHKFDWKLEDGMKTKDLNMEEKFGLTLAKAHPLMAVPIQSS